MSDKKSERKQEETKPEVVERGALAATAHRELDVYQLRNRINSIQRLIAEVLKPDVHYYSVGYGKGKALGKSGAEYLLLLFGLHLTDVDVVDLSTDDAIRYRVTTRIRDAHGFIVGVGMGECSTDEAKYAWRRSVCDEEWEDTDRDRRRKKWEEDGSFILQVRTNPADLANTVLKMAKKRSMVDAVLTGTAASDCFEQDLEEDGYPVGDRKPRSGRKTKPTNPGKAEHVDTVKEVTVKKTGKSAKGDWTIHRVVAGDGTAFETFDDKLAGVAKELAGQGVVVTLLWEPASNPKYASKLVGIEDGPSGDQDPPPPSDDDAPPLTDADAPPKETPTPEPSEGPSREEVMDALKAEKKRAGFTWDEVAELAKKAGVKSLSSKNWSVADIQSILASFP